MCRVNVTRIPHWNTTTTNGDEPSAGECLEVEHCNVEGDSTRVPLRLFAQRGRNRTHRAGEKRGPGEGKRDTAQQWLG